MLARDGRIVRRSVTYDGKRWEGFAVDASPAMAVEFGVMERADRKISLAVSGINYGENIGSIVTASGTIGAALEAADFGIMAMAVSLELLVPEYHEFTADADFTTAVHFTRKFATAALNANLPSDVKILKVEVPAAAGINAGWMVTSQDRFPYYQARIEERDDPFNSSTKVSYIPQKGKFNDQNSDAFALSKGLVSVPPLSTDLTSRIDLNNLFKGLE